MSTNVFKSKNKGLKLGSSERKKNGKKRKGKKEISLSPFYSSVEIIDIDI